MELGTDAHELLAGLNDPQREAVLHTDGPLLILAGPGSGKTRVVTRRAAYLAATVTDPWHILAIAFTNKAAGEMRERVDALGVAQGMTVCTFHALCAKLLRVHSDRAGVPRNFTIFDRDDRRKLIKQAVERAGLSTDNWRPAAMEHEIGLAKNEMLTADRYEKQACDWRQRSIARVYTAYEELLGEMGGLDFDDLLMRMALLLDRDPELCDMLADRFRYILIDEYQDTNRAQYLIAQHLGRRHQNLCATGDPDQSIYGWRGANIENILSFEKDYPEAKVIRLEQNYRSTKRILAAAGALIGGNVQRKAKALWTENADGPAVRVMECETGEHEAAEVAGDIIRQRRAGVLLGDIAVFYRVNSLSRAIEEVFLREGISYQIARGVEFYSRREIKDILAYLRVLVNPADEVALLRIMNTPPRGIGDTTIERLSELARSRGQSMHGVLLSGDDLTSLGRSAAKVTEFAVLVANLRTALELPAREAIEFVVSHSGLRAHYGAEAQGDDGPINNINELVSAATEFAEEHPEGTIVDWLEHTALLGDIDTIRDESGLVTLMTLHAAKGLEFDVVYLIGLEDGLLPFRREDEAADEEEERRLLFVGMTRAKRRLTLLRARYRMLRGVTRRTVRSPFLDELPRDQIECPEAAEPRARPRPATVDHGRLPDDIEAWGVGTIVRHPQHGVGRIMSMQRGARRTHVDVQFRTGPRIAWVLEFAGLTRIDGDEIGDDETCDEAPF